MAKVKTNSRTTRRARSSSSGAATTGKSGTPSPKRLRFHVFWSAEYAQGKEYARTIFEWFRGDPGDLLRCGTGIPVEYHCVSEKQESVLDPAMDDSEIHILVLLIDNEFVLNRTLRQYVDRLGSREPENKGADNDRAGEDSRAKRDEEKETRIVIPVHLDRSAIRLAGVVGERNSVHVDVGPIPSEETDKDRLERRVPRLLGGLTQMAARLVVRGKSPLAGIGFEGFNPDSPRAKLKVFISHAKKDGRDIAEKLRVEILRRGQLDVFFDEADLATGSRWAKHLVESAKNASGVMLVLFTDAYSSRRWCLREVRLAREPIRICQDTNKGSLWSVIPVRVLAALTRHETVLPSDFAGLPIQQHTETSIGITVDALVRDYVIQAQDAVRALNLLEKEQVHVALTCRPDARVLGSIISAPRSEGKLIVAHPGAGLTSESVLSLQATFPGGTFRTFESMEVSLSQNRQKDPEPKWIGVSIGDELDEAHLSIGPEHLREALVRVAQCLFRSGFNTAYGGDLRAEGFTQILFEVARGEADEDADTRVRWRRLANYLAWPRFDQLSKPVHADLIDVCRFVECKPSQLGIHHPSWNQLPEAVHGEWSALSLSQMRNAMQQGNLTDDDAQKMSPLAGRVILGGKLNKFSGAIPGILEEAILCIREGLPTVVLGGFGGAAGLLAQYLSGKPQARAKLEKYRDECGTKQSIPCRDLVSAEALLNDLLAREPDPKMLNTNLSDQDLHIMFTTYDVSEACRIVNTVFPIPR